jgi:hypothetical protein
MENITLMKLFPFFHYFLFNERRVDVFMPPKFEFTYKTKNILYDACIYKNVMTTSEYDFKKFMHCSKILYDRNEYKTLYWNATGVLNVLNNENELYRLNIDGTLNLYNIPTSNLTITKPINLCGGDFITSACKLDDIIVSISFYNSIYIMRDIDNVIYFPNKICARTFLFAKKIKLFRNNGGPLHILMQFQKGGLFFIKIDNFNIIQRSCVLETDNIKDFYFITQLKIVCLLTDNRIKIINLNSLNTEKEIHLEYDCDIFVSKENELFLYAKKKWFQYR